MFKNMARSEITNPIEFLKRYSDIYQEIKATSITLDEFEMFLNDYRKLVLDEK